MVGDVCLHVYRIFGTFILSSMEYSIILWGVMSEKIGFGSYRSFANNSYPYSKKKKERKKM